MDGFLDWLTSLPLATLYLALGAAAALENVFPPLPADTVVAFGSFLAARGQGSAVGSFLSTWSGNILGAALMYFVGRRYGAGFIERRMKGSAKARQRIEALYGKYGLGAIFLSRFIPAVRAVVPPFAGALKISAVPALAMMAFASGLWYGVITWFAFRIGDNWDALTEQIASANRIAAIAAVVIVVLGLGIFFWRRRRSEAS